MKTLVLVFTVAFMPALQLTAQKTNYWKGGFPGQENEWNQPNNWSLGFVPDWTCHVIIPDVSTASCPDPVLKNGDAEVQSVIIQVGASFTIASGACLWLLGFNSFEVPLQNEGTLALKGKILTEPTGNTIAKR